MDKRKQIIAVLSGITTLAVFSTDGATQPETTQESVRAEEQIQQQKRIYGSQLMTKQERNEHREKMRQAVSQEERGRIRAEHHEQMKARAKARDITLPDEPPARGMGQGTGGGARKWTRAVGTGRSQGMGPGGRKGRGSRRY